MARGLFLRRYAAGGAQSARKVRRTRVAVGCLAENRRSAALSRRTRRASAGELGIPVKLIGIGEALEDLRPFDADDYARALLT